MHSPVRRQSSPLSGRKSTYPPVQIPQASSKAIQPLRALGGVSVDNIKPTDYVAVQRAGDQKETSTDARVMAYYMKMGYLKGIKPELVAAVMESIERTGRGVVFGHCGGAIGRVPTKDTAFAHRYATNYILSSVRWDAGENSADYIRQGRETWKNFEPFIGGFYINDMQGDESAKAVDANYLENFPRLVEVKNKYDPGNLFRLNANIKPTV